MADFTVEFNIENSDGADYTQFLQGLRDRVASGDLCYYLPVLSRQSSTPNRWFDVVLRAGDQTVTLRIRRDNLYLDGYRRGSTWYEFQHGGPSLIPGATILRFDGSYTSLQRVADQRREAIPLGQRALVNAVHALADPNVNDQARARQLMVAIQMICESMRFQSINRHLANEWENHSSPPLTLVNLENAWGGLSEALIHAEQDTTSHTFRYRVDNDLEFHTVGTAAGAIAMLVRRSASGSSRATRAIAATPWEDYPKGRALVEIFWMRIDKIDGENLGSLYGTVKVTDGPGSQDVYNRDKNNIEYIHADQFALLTGPPEAISAADSFSIDVDLWNKNAWLSDHGIAQGSISFNVFDPGNKYDENVTYQVSGEYGSVTLNYVILSNAAQALVEVILIDGDGEDPADVYGNISADNGYAYYGESELFRKASSEHIDVRPGAKIPLLRSAIAVPMTRSLRIKALLYDHDVISSDDEIANGVAVFDPLILQSENKYITGKYGKIEVRVTWN
ncbi:ribosome-inactivating protein [Hypoxylon sp. NC0597]|nr:ribosome-inactivating protein [Hypoxylon sp. NC0597]